MTAPFSAAAARNRQAILEVLARVLAPRSRVLEIGSGTGQHAAWFTARRGDLHWQTSERPDCLPLLAAGLSAYATRSLPAPLPLDVFAGPWPGEEYQAVYSANTAHILPWDGVRAMVTGARSSLVADGLFVLYGPFSRGGVPTSEGNRRFDLELRQSRSGMGIRDVEAMDAAALGAGLVRVAEYAMPANNLMLIWRRGALDS